jgi:hypothetical protein
MTHSVADLAAAARRLAAIDPSRAGVGGLRLQLELALFPDPAPALRPIAASHPTLQQPAAAQAVAAPIAARPSPVEPPAPPTAEPAPPRPTAAPAPAPAQPIAPPETTATPPTPAAVAPVPSKAATQRSAPAVVSASGAAPDASTAVSADLAVLRERWPEIVARISTHPPTKPLIVVCRPISVEDGIVTLGFPEDKAFLRQVAERRRSVLEDNISAVLGRPVGVRCVATNIDVLPDLPSDEEAAWILAQAQRIFGDDTADAAEVG